MENKDDTLLETFLFETDQMIGQTEEILIQSEKAGGFDEEAINALFRIMHTIKGSAAMMRFTSLSETAHRVEDLFFFIRENHFPVDAHRTGDIVFSVLDFMKDEIGRIGNGDDQAKDNREIITSIQTYLEELKSKAITQPSRETPTKPLQETSSPSSPLKGKPDFRAWIKFQDDCEMKGLRALAIVKQLQEVGRVVQTHPENLRELDEAEEIIRKEGLTLAIETKLSLDELHAYLEEHTVEMKEVRVTPTVQAGETEADASKPQGKNSDDAETQKQTRHSVIRQSLISVNVDKLDKLMDIVGELVIAEEMVTGNSELAGMQLRSFRKASSQMKKITSELQDIVMSIRMVPIGPTFQSMQRIVRDMCRKLGKDVELEIIGEETEVDKKVIDVIADPLMHLIRNCVDHGIEDTADREKAGKPAQGRVSLEARHEGGDVWISVADDGKGLNKEAILRKAKENGLLTKPENEHSEKEIWAYILKPGFSTKQKVTEFSGRGVGMDVVTKSLEMIGGRLNIESVTGKGTTFQIRIPLTLAIIDGMEVAVGEARYTVPITLIKEALQPKGYPVVKDPSGHEVIMIRGKCHEIIRLHREFGRKRGITDLEKGILLIVENEEKPVALFADRLIGEHQVVVKPVPRYIGRLEGLSGCAILGDGSISMILDVAGLIARLKSGEGRADDGIKSETASNG